MYSVGDFVVHPGQGVCQVIDVSHQQSDSYCLVPLSRKHNTQITFPLAQEGRLRSVISQEDARSLIEEYPNVKLTVCEQKNASLEESYYKQAIREGSCEDVLRIAKTFRSRISQARSQNKRPSIYHQRIFKLASSRCLFELAAALQVSPDEIKDEFASKYGISLGIT